MTTTLLKPLTARPFFEARRTKLKLNPTQMAARLGTTAQAIVWWEQDKRVPSLPITALAIAYEVSESQMEKEVMAIRRRIEARRAAVA